MRPVWLFDLDGTLVDSMPTGVGIVVDFLKEQGIELPPDMIKTLTPLGYKGVAQYYAEKLGVPMTAAEIYAVFQRETRKAYGESIPLKPHVEETLQALKQKGVRLCVLTASPNVLSELCLKRLQIFDLFEKVWSIDDFSLTKADEAIYLEAAKRLGVDISDCVMVDDHLGVLKVAKAAGMATVGVYDEYSSGAQEEICALADGYVVDFADILSFAE